MRGSGWSGIVGIVMLTWCSAPGAHASYYDLYGFTPRSTGMGGAMTATVRGYAATFYNPAALTASREGAIGVVAHLRAPELFVDRQPLSATEQHPTVLPDTGGSASLGWAYPLEGGVAGKLAFGVSLHLPVGRLVRVQGVDRLSPQYYMFQNLHDKMMFLAAVAYEPIPWLSFGAGIQILSDLTGGAQLELDIVDGRFDTREFSVDISPTASPNIGVHLRPLPELSLGLTWRGTSVVHISVPVALSEGETLEMLLDVSQTVHFAPHRVTLGGSYRFVDLGLTFAADLVLALWSFAPDPSPQLSVDMGGPLLSAAGLQEALDVSMRAAPLELNFSDTLSVKLGVEWAPLSWLQVRTGYAFRPTPAPIQQDQSAYLDNDSHTLAFGLGFALLEPSEKSQVPLRLELAAQAILLAPRAFERGGGEGTADSLRHGGEVWSFSLSFSHAY